MTRDADTLVDAGEAPREAVELTRQIARLHDVFLAVLDGAVSSVAAARGIACYDGPDGVATFDGAGALRVTAGMLAYRIAAMIVTPGAAGAEFELAAFHAALRARFGP